MATLTIRQLDEKTKMRLKIRGAHHGRSMDGGSPREVALRVSGLSSSTKSGRGYSATFRPFWRDYTRIASTRRHSPNHFLKLPG